MSSALRRQGADGRDVRVIDVLSKAKERAEHDLKTDPLVLADVRLTLGTTYYNLSLYDEAIATMEKDPTQSYNQNDATGFISLNALRLKASARRRK